MRREKPLGGRTNLVPGLHLEEVALVGVVEGLLPLDAVGGGALGHGFDPVPRTQGRGGRPPAIKEGLDRFPAGLSWLSGRAGRRRGFLRPLEDLPWMGTVQDSRPGPGPGPWPVDREPEQGNARPQQDPPGRGKLSGPAGAPPTARAASPTGRTHAVQDRYTPAARPPPPLRSPTESHRWSDSPRM